MAEHIRSQPRDEHTPSRIRAEELVHTLNTAQVEVRMLKARLAEAEAREHSIFLPTVAHASDLAILRSAPNRNLLLVGTAPDVAGLNSVVLTQGHRPVAHWTGDFAGASIPIARGPCLSSGGKV